MNNEMSNGGLGIATIIGVIFIVLKLAQVGEVANWSWVWVLCPFWFGFAFISFVVVVGIILASFKKDNFSPKFRRKF